MSWLQHRLVSSGYRVSLSTLSYWRSGRRQPEHQESLEALGEVERLLALDPGFLRDAIGPPRRPGPPTPTIAFDDLIARPDPLVEEALSRLGLGDWTTHFTELSSHVIVEVDEHGSERAVTIRAVLRGRSPHAQRYPFFLFAGETMHGPVEFLPQTGCRVGREIKDHAQGLFVAEVILDKALGPGDTAFIEVSVILAPQRFSGYQQFVARRIAELVIMVQFHPDRLPVSIHSFQHADGHSSTLPYDRAAGTSAHLVLRAFGPGTAGLTWTWSEG
ncbi:hypothetical protein [Nocardioides oleivorans]|nr:hypothetical protein [Nocardioides oleivorans]